MLSSGCLYVSATGVICCVFSTGLLQSFSLVSTFSSLSDHLVPDMTYKVFGGTLNLTQSINRLVVSFVKCLFMKRVYSLHLLLAFTAGYLRSMSLYTISRVFPSAV